MKTWLITATTFATAVVGCSAFPQRPVATDWPVEKRTRDNDFKYLTDRVVNFAPLNTTTNGTTPSTGRCTLDQGRRPGNLTVCGNATLFEVWRPKAHMIAREGWMNDPMTMYQRDDGSLHIGYQCHPQHIQWGNISNCAAVTNDFVTFTDLGTDEEPRTIYPSTVYDIRGVFDGTVLKGQGPNGTDAILYTSTHPGPLGATVNETEGVETQSVAYTSDGGETWTKLPFGAGGNPVIYEWPMQNLTGFRDPYIFTSPRFAALLSAANSTSNTNGTDVFATISGGVHGQGSKLFLYRQRETNNVVDWDYLGPLIETGARQSWSDWSGNYGTNFETASVNRLNASGDAFDAGEDATAVDFISMGTEQGRPDHQNHWPLWVAVNHSVTPEGYITSEILYSGVTDWGQSYAFVNFPYNGTRQISIGWTYEDDEDLVLAKQQGYQGSFTTFRDVYVKNIRNVDPEANPGLYERGSWGVINETDGSVTIQTLGQKIVSETLEGWKAGSNVSISSGTTLNSSGFAPLATQPVDRHYVVSARYEFANDSNSVVGMRVLASNQEYTDILYDPTSENLTVTRDQSSLVTSYGTQTEIAKLRLWKTLDSDVRVLNLTVVVDNSVLEVHANDEAVITTRVYPWLTNSTNAGILAANVSGTPVQVSNIELWDGLVNAWPERPSNTSRGLVWDGPIAAIWGYWTGI
ncbi:hypothetical protein OIO90_003157 [Microbotryomycetes sp. JL221]|nr:hypothetical protein OIO90_003157 [Microbotryomycetes sp. JL221]